MGGSVKHYRPKYVRIISLLFVVHFTVVLNLPLSQQTNMKHDEIRQDKPALQETASVEAEKVLDSVKCTFLYELQAKFVFNASAIVTFKSQYENPAAKIIVNGSLSNSFFPHRGSKQGCGAS